VATIVRDNIDAKRISSDTHEVVGQDLLDDSLIVLLKRCRRLRTISLVACLLTDKSLVQLAHSADLEEIDLSLCNMMSDATPIALSTLPKLRLLLLRWRYSVADPSLEALSHSKTIRTLAFDSCEDITDVGLRSLAKIEQLEHLALPAFAEFTDDGFLALGALTNLKTLCISGPHRISLEAESTLKSILPSCEVKIR
jgi:hypothetical protein